MGICSSPLWVSLPGSNVMDWWNSCSAGLDHLWVYVVPLVGLSPRVKCDGLVELLFGWTGSFVGICSSPLWVSLPGSNVMDWWNSGSAGLDHLWVYVVPPCGSLSQGQM